MRAGAADLISGFEAAWLFPYTHRARRRRPIPKQIIFLKTIF